jgi:hypothetical protein
MINLGDKIFYGKAGGSQHNLSFKGDSTIFSQLGTNGSEFGVIEVLGVNKNVQFKKDIYADEIQIGANATATAYGNVKF